MNRTSAWCLAAQVRAVHSGDVSQKGVKQVARMSLDTKWKSAMAADGSDR